VSADGAGSRLRRGPEQIRAAAGQMDVHEQVEEAGLRILRQSGPWLFHQCPNFDDHTHGDRHPSAQSNVETGFWQCFGCGAKGRWPGLRSGAPASANGSSALDVPDVASVEPYEPAPTWETSWDYRDEKGNVVYRMIRIDQGDDGKSFFVRHENEHGTWVLGKPGSGFVLYRLPELIEAVAAGETVYVAEGEKDAESLREARVAATCNTGGANKPGEWAAHAHYLQGAEVVVVADRDRAGLRHALDVREKLRGVAASVEVRLPAVGKDVSDHLHNGLGIEELIAWEPPNSQVQKSATAGGGFGGTLVWHRGTDVPEIAEVEWIAWPFVAREAKTLFIGDIKHGKTTYSLGLAEAVVNGWDFLGRPTVQMPVVYLSEQTHSSLYQQLPAGLRGSDDFHFLCFPENFGVSWPDFARGGIERALETGSGLLIVDTAAKFARLQADQNNSESAVMEFWEALDEALGHGVASQVLKHERKSGGDITKASSGSSQWGANADVLVRITKEPDMARHQRKLENLSRFQDSIGEWTCLYDPATRRVHLEGDFQQVAAATCKNALVEWMEQREPGHEFTPKELSALTDHSPNAVQKALAAHPDRFERVGHGKYRLTQPETAARVGRP
jgi:5S rRNA maturation endonuclease (ribonuclease M5)